ncbi:class I SAM-dependent methyltransferase family protein [Streptomyces sp. HNM0574]|uniref:class I SAM-dependent methyltransferase family protein n=1 Tax=Streptomyces sp. HNM0574 TaxID=2714954 RepID=UPI00146DAEFD|nr:class I SAM-dependent methyltransferase family protein [Streptomyces sp. HNM0574]NLU66437.1 methyltransferase domain-containing protein [Streptomyces sp. HNM0574]
MRSRVTWAVVRGALRTVGRAGRSVRLGYRHGFESGMLVDHLYAAEARGLPGIGAAVDRRLLASEEARTVRARGALLQQALREEIAVRGGEIRILDVASGPGRYLLDLLAEDQPGSQLRVVCRDALPACRARGRRLARERGLPEGAVTYEPGDALAPAPLADGGTPDIVVASGLYELVPDDETFLASLERLRALLAPDGTLLFTGLSSPAGTERARQVLTDRNGARLRLRHRPAEEAEAWAMKAGFPAEGLHSRTDASGVCTVTRCGL